MFFFLILTAESLHSNQSAVIQDSNPSVELRLESANCEEKATSDVDRAPDTDAVSNDNASVGLEMDTATMVADDDDDEDLDDSESSVHGDSLLPEPAIPAKLEEDFYVARPTITVKCTEMTPEAETTKGSKFSVIVVNRKLPEPRVIAGQPQSSAATTAVPSNANVNMSSDENNTRQSGEGAVAALEDQDQNFGSENEKEPLGVIVLDSGGLQLFQIFFWGS